MVVFTCFYKEESLKKNSCCNTPYIHAYFKMTIISFLDFGLGQLSTHIALVHIFFSNIHKEHPSICRITAHGTVPGGKML
jgi:hypothetical protein